MFCGNARPENDHSDYLQWLFLVVLRENTATSRAFSTLGVCSALCQE